MNRVGAPSKLTRSEVSRAVAELMPNIIRGTQLDFFIKRGVTQTQFLVLASIRAYERCTMSTLAHNLHVRMPTATGIVDRLVRAGYVRRLPDPQDRRQVIVTLTAKGEAFIRDFQAVVRTRWEEVLKTLAPQELEAFYGVVTKLSAQLRAGG